MKKLVLLTLGLGLFAVSYGTKESSMSKNNTDSTDTSANARTMPPATADTMTTGNADSTKMRTDSVTTPPTRKFKV